MNKQFKFKLDKYSLLAEVETKHLPSEIEAALNKEGVTLGFESDGDEKPLERYLSGERSLEPYLKFGDTHDLLAAVSATLANGITANTFLTPRSAAGANLRYLLTGEHGRVARLDTATLRVRKLPETKSRFAYRMKFFDEALGVLRDQVQAKNEPHVLRLYHSESIVELFGSDNTDCLLLFGFEGEKSDVDFRSARMKDAVEDLSAVKLLPENKFEKLLNAEKFAPFYGDEPRKQFAEVVMHMSLVWSNVLPMLRELYRRSGGIYRVQASITGSWHVAALLSLRLMSFEGERDRSLIAKEIQGILAVLKHYQAGILELRPLEGKIDKRWGEIFSDPLTERVFK